MESVEIICTMLESIWPSAFVTDISKRQSIIAKSNPRSNHVRCHKDTTNQKHALLGKVNR